MLLGGPLTAVILACFAVGFALWGIAARMRVFLYAGVTFLAIDVVAQVVRAAMERAWIWWVSAIVLGLALMVLFAWLERRRDEVRRLVVKIRSWQ